jgi:hypothetical protein
MYDGLSKKIGFLILVDESAFVPKHRDFGRQRRENKDFIDWLGGMVRGLPALSRFGRHAHHRAIRFKSGHA